ncbi:hypothetical protein PGTUg99_033198 [Puccinia graminis f. sp. tritici]|uniref:Uncharacterized protein n=1 Tax=Puccinia graminis f. sp. tritici TaxID=56615 RepID=A0A5B0N2H8_PUCGR|nr:hypothetical protein PGTUg99_033198 [Puccinia graminis f. sp. tritici]
MQIDRSNCVPIRPSSPSPAKTQSRKGSTNLQGPGRDFPHTHARRLSQQTENRARLDDEALKVYGTARFQQARQLPSGAAIAQTMGLPKGSCATSFQQAQTSPAGVGMRCSAGASQKGGWPRWPYDCRGRSCADAPCSKIENKLG